MNQAALFGPIRLPDITIPYPEGSLFAFLGSGTRIKDFWGIYTPRISLSNNQGVRLCPNFPGICNSTQIRKRASLGIARPTDYLPRTRTDDLNKGVRTGEKKKTVVMETGLDRRLIM
jgi:hypothetical protein